MNKVFIILTVILLVLGELAIPANPTEKKIPKNKEKGTVQHFV